MMIKILAIIVIILGLCVMVSPPKHSYYYERPDPKTERPDLPIIPDKFLSNKNKGREK
jgi:hypothetical protein